MVSNSSGMKHLAVLLHNGQTYFLTITLNKPLTSLHYETLIVILKITQHAISLRLKILTLNKTIHVLIHKQFIS